MDAEITLARVGNIEYARENKSFGLTTLRNRHARVRGGNVEFDFRGKHGTEHHIDLRSKRLAPVAAVLLVAIVAVPMLLSSSSSAPR